MKKLLLTQIICILIGTFLNISAQCPENFDISYLSDNLIPNASFESGNTDFESIQKYFGDCQGNTTIQAPDQYSVIKGSPADCNQFWTPNLRANDGDAFMISDFPEFALNQDIWCQKIDVNPNSTVEFSGDFANVLNELYNDADPTFRIFAEGNNGDIGVIYESASDIAISEGAGWLSISTTFDSGDNERIKICIQNTVQGHNGLDLAIDNLSARMVECIEPDEETDNNSGTAGTGNSASSGSNNSVDFFDCDEQVEENMASISNGSFDDGNIFIHQNGNIVFSANRIEGWDIANYNNTIELFASGHQGVPAYEGEFYAEANAHTESSLYQDIATMPGDVIHYSFAHRGRNGQDMIGVFMGVPRPRPQEPIASELVNTYTTDSDRWIMYQGKYEVPAGQTITRFSLKALRSQDGNITTGNFIDAVTVQSISASCENPRPGNVEICANGIDDDGDGLIDNDDPDCSTSGGNDGGLESNGRLAEKIFQRTLNRRIEPSIVKNEKSQMIRKVKTKGYGVFNQVNQRSLLSVEEFIPLDTIENTETYISSPKDLEAITNATEVFSVDIFRDDNRLAAIFASTTENGVYEHTKYICDRLKGGIINDLRSERIGYADFIVADLIQPEGNREYAISFSARETEDGKLDIQSHWSLEFYPQNERYYNFQIWASNMEDLKKLTFKTMQLLNEYKQVGTMTTTAAPSVFVSHGEYSHGKLDLKLINKKSSTSITLEGERTQTETMTKESINQSSSIEGHYSEFVTLNVGSVYDMGFRIKHDNDHIFDDLFIADGLWFIDTKDGNLEYEVAPESENPTGDIYPLERSIEVSGTFNNTLSIYRSMKANFRSVDVNDFNTLHFNVSGAQAMQIVLIKRSITEWDAQYKTSITTTGASNEINIPFSRFSNGTDEQIDLSDIQAIIFKFENDGESEEFDIEISSLDFRNEADHLPENTFDNTTMVVSPNPSNDNVNVLWTSTEEGIHSGQLLTIDGKVIKEFEGLTSRGHNQIMIERENLNAGIYFVSIIERSGKILTEKIVLID